MVIKPNYNQEVHLKEVFTQQVIMNVLICMFSLVQSQNVLGLLAKKKASLAFSQSLAFHTHHSSKSRERNFKISIPMEINEIGWCM